MGDGGGLQVYFFGAVGGGEGVLAQGLEAEGAHVWGLSWGVSGEGEEVGGEEFWSLEV